MSNDFFEFEANSIFGNLRPILAYQEFQGHANWIIGHYDYNDILAGIKYAKSKIPSVKGVSTDKGIEIVGNLFNELYTYLETNCKTI